MDIGRIQEAVDIGSLATYLQIQTQAGAKALKDKTGVWVSDSSGLEVRSQQFRTLQHVLHTKPDFTGALLKSFSELKGLESDLEALTSKPSDLETEAFNELLFLKEWSVPLNFVPMLLVFWSLLRVYLFPGMALLMPVVMLILPFIIVRFIFHMPMSISGYMTLVSAIFSGQVGALFQPDALLTPKEPVSGAPPFNIFQLFKTGLLVGTIVQSFLQPYWSFLHLSAIDAFIQKKVEALLRF
jgi:hypothetical protein